MNNPTNSIHADCIGKYCVIRGRGFGVFAGTVSQVEGSCVKLTNARRLWYWDGAASISQIAAEGVTAPCNCKFSMAVGSIVLRDWIEIIPCTGLAVEVHHIKALKTAEGWERRLDWDNLQAVCTSCHNQLDKRFGSQPEPGVLDMREIMKNL